MKKKNTDELRIAAKTLGELNMPDFCPQLFWVKSKTKFKTPFSIFPGIFSTLDKYQKDITSFSHVYRGQWPSWICGDIKDIVPCPHWSKFCYTDEETGITVSGAMDECFLMVDETLLISDNKLAKFTENQDKLRPMYDAQLNAYAEIAERTGLGKVSKIQLIYHEPMTNLDKDQFDRMFAGDGYLLRFAPKYLEVKRDPELIPRLLRRAKEILSSPTPPEPLDGKISKDLELVLAMAKAYNEAQIAKNLQGDSGLVGTAEPVPARTLLRVMYEGTFIAGVTVEDGLDTEGIRKAICEDPIIQMYNQNAVDNPNGITWELSPA